MQKKKIFAYTDHASTMCGGGNSINHALTCMITIMAFCFFIAEFIQQQWIGTIGRTFWHHTLWDTHTFRWSSGTNSVHV